MINKYSGVTLIVLAVLSIIASWMIYKKYTKNFYVSTNTSIESHQLIKDIEIKPAAFASLKIMQDIVKKLSETAVTSEGHTTLALSPVSSTDKRPLVTIPSEKEKQRRHAAYICSQARNLNVSMSYISSDEKYAVVANKFIREGQIINKFKVLNIEADSIKVQKSGVKCNIKVSSSDIAKL